MSKPRTIKLFCPSLSKLIQWLAWEEQKLDVGSIARAFGLDPSTVKLNGHLISRGVDLVSSSVTWRSLLKFFSARGLSTGIDDQDALIVDGKLCKVGSKRSHDSEERLPGKVVAQDISSICQRPSSEDIRLLKNKKLRDRSSECGEREGHVSITNGLGFKRQHSLEDLSLLKRLRINESSSPPDFRDTPSNNCSTTISRTLLRCSYASQNLKRPRENEVIATTVSACKRIR